LKSGTARQSGAAIEGKVFGGNHAHSVRTVLRLMLMVSPSCAAHDATARSTSASKSSSSFGGPFTRLEIGHIFVGSDRNDQQVMRVGLAAQPPLIVGRPQDRRHSVVNPGDLVEEGLEAV
jgi:hypothetical protein